MSVDVAPTYATHTEDLYSWSGNYDHPTPFSLFLDLIGWSDEQLGEPLFDLNQVSGKLGYMELGMLASALNEYADRPGAVMEYVEELMRAEEDDDE